MCLILYVPHSVCFRYFADEDHLHAVVAFLRSQKAASLSVHVRASCPHPYCAAEALKQHHAPYRSSGGDGGGEGEAKEGPYGGGGGGEMKGEAHYSPEGTSRLVGEEKKATIMRGLMTALASPGGGAPPRSPRSPHSPHSPHSTHSTHSSPSSAHGSVQSGGRSPRGLRAESPVSAGSGQNETRVVFDTSTTPPPSKEEKRGDPVKEERGGAQTAKEAGRAAVRTDAVDYNAAAAKTRKGRKNGGRGKAGVGGRGGDVFKGRGGFGPAPDFKGGKTRGGEGGGRKVKKKKKKSGGGENDGVSSIDELGSSGSDFMKISERREGRKKSWRNSGIAMSPRRRHSWHSMVTLDPDSDDPMVYVRVVEKNSDGAAGAAGAGKEGAISPAQHHHHHHHHHHHEADGGEVEGGGGKVSAAVPLTPGVQGLLDKAGDELDHSQSFRDQMQRLRNGGGGGSGDGTQRELSTSGDFTRTGGSSSSSSTGREGKARSYDSHLDDLRHQLYKRCVTTGHLFREMDADRDGHVTLREFKHGLGLCGVAREAGEKVLRGLFKTFDTNGDGIISWEEMISGLEDQFVASPRDVDTAVTVVNLANHALSSLTEVILSETNRDDDDEKLSTSKGSANGDAGGSVTPSDAGKKAWTWNGVQTLILANNQIEHLSAVTGVLPAPFHSLLELNLSFNKLRGALPDFSLSCAPNLEYLDVGHNALKRLGGLEGCHRLRQLDASHNQIRGADGVGHIATLEELDLSHNLVKGQPGVRLLSLNLKLRYLDLRGNPLEAKQRYRATLSLLLPTLDHLDGTPLPASAQRTHARRAAAEPAGYSAASQGRHHTTRPARYQDPTKIRGTQTPPNAALIRSRKELLLHPREHVRSLKPADFLRTPQKSTPIKSISSGNYSSNSHSNNTSANTNTNTNTNTNSNSNSNAMNGAMATSGPRSSFEIAMREARRSVPGLGTPPHSRTTGGGGAEENASDTDRAEEGDSGEADADVVGTSPGSRLRSLSENVSSQGDDGSFIQYDIIEEDEEDDDLEEEELQRQQTPREGGGCDDTESQAEVERRRLGGKSRAVEQSWAESVSMKGESRGEIRRLWGER